MMVDSGPSEDNEDKNNPFKLLSEITTLQNFM